MKKILLLTTSLTLLITGCDTTFSGSHSSSGFCSVSSDRGQTFSRSTRTEGNRLDGECGFTGKEGSIRMDNHIIRLTDQKLSLNGIILGVNIPDDRTTTIRVIADGQAKRLTVDGLSVRELATTKKAGRPLARTD